MRFVIVAMFAIAVVGPVVAVPKITDIQASHGQLGPERKSQDYVRGDELYLRFNISGFTADKDGKLACELAMLVLDSANKEILNKAVPLQQTLALGGGICPAHVSVTIGEEFPFGEYTLKVTVTDNLTRTSDSFERKFKCKEKEFSLVAVRFSQDADGKIPATVGGTVSQTLYFRARGVGFDKSKGELDLEMTIEIFDAKGKPTMAKPIRSIVHSEDPEVVKTATVINLLGELTLNRPGDFMLKISLVDKVSKKTAVFESPMKVNKP